MSVQSEIERINTNVQTSLNTIASTGVSIPENANSDNLPAATLALANEKQDKLTGTPGQVVGFDENGNPIAEEKQKGDKGESGVYYGTGEPGEDYDVWIDPNGDPTEIVDEQARAGVAQLNEEVAALQTALIGVSALIGGEV